MRWWSSAVLLLASTATTSAVHIPTAEERLAAWEKLTTVKDFSDAVPDGYKLVLVNPIWRHGDRGPAQAFPGDKVKEDDWDFGGGGYGELSPIGMRQHYELGMKLYDRYAANDQFLSSRYRAKEIYAKSTDFNRTLISAMSNFAGMYSRVATAINGTDYPEIDAWPTSFVPIPIHTAEYMRHEGDPDSPCPRQDDLYELVQQHPEYIAFDTKQRTQQTLTYLRDNTGSDANGINFDNIYILRQGMLCESIHFADDFATWYPWYTQDVKQRTDEIDNQNIDFQNGIFAGSGVVQGYDLAIEIPRVRGGTLINDVVNTATGVLDCYVSNNYGENTRCTEKDHFLSNLKYYVISAHDSTIAAYLTTLGAKSDVITGGGYPSYSSAVITEFFIDTTSGRNERKFRLLFHDDEFSDFRVITPFVTGCVMGEDFCKIEALQALADKYAPPGGIADWCNTRINGPAADTTPKAPPPPASTPAPSTPTTAKKTDDNSGTTVPTPPSTTSPSSLISCVSAAALVLVANIMF